MQKKVCKGYLNFCFRAVHRLCDLPALDPRFYTVSEALPTMLYVSGQSSLGYCGVISFSSIVYPAWLCNDVTEEPRVKVIRPVWWEIFTETNWVALKRIMSSVFLVSRYTTNFSWEYITIMNVTWYNFNRIKSCYVHLSS